MNPDLASRIIDGAHRGRLILTLDEVTEMLDTVKPGTTVIVAGNPVDVTTLPITSIDPYDPFPTSTSPTSSSAPAGKPNSSARSPTDS